MSRVVLLQPSGLVAQELLRALQGHPLAEDLKLLSSVEEEIGQLTDAAGGAGLVSRADAPAVAAADAIVVLGPLEAYRELLQHRRPGASVILAGAGATPDDGTPVVAGVNLDAAEAGATLVSPDPGAVLLAHLLAPLLEAGDGGRLETAVATLVQPASIYDRPGLDELFAQAGRMVSMQSQAPSELFGDRQLAFNLYPAPRPPRHLLDELAKVLGVTAGEAPALSAHVLQGSVFHGYSALVHVTLDGDAVDGDAVDAAALGARLAASPVIELTDAEADAPAPLDVPASDKILVAAVDAEAGGAGGGYWLWSVMDNLTRGGALNVLAILEAVLPPED